MTLTTLEVTKQGPQTIEGNHRVACRAGSISQPQGLEPGRCGQRLPLQPLGAASGLCSDLLTWGQYWRPAVTVPLKLASGHSSARMEGLSARITGVSGPQGWGSSLDLRWPSKIPCEPESQESPCQTGLGLMSPSHCISTPIPSTRDGKWLGLCLCSGGR